MKSVFELTALCYRMRLLLPAPISTKRPPASSPRDAGLYLDTRYVTFQSLDLGNSD
jgi:hypothetical protein